MISVIVPTHNRVSSLKRLLDNLESLAHETNFEIVVVDNNSSDTTKSLVQSLGAKVRYVFEGSTSFTRARNTGAENAQGDILLYLDDDVEVLPGSLSEIAEFFTSRNKCGVLGGKVLPEYEATPPPWSLELQESFNGWSLFDLGDTAIETHAVPGPMMAIRKKAFEEVGGFPSDTIGVETNADARTFKKLYIGPGDYGFCHLCNEKGYETHYSPSIGVRHHISEVRFGREFWLSRLIGEAHYHAITARKMPGLEFLGERRLFPLIMKTLQFKAKAIIARLFDKETPLLTEEMWREYYRARLNMELVLLRNPTLVDYVWDLGINGVEDKDFDTVIKRLPPAYRRLALT